MNQRPSLPDAVVYPETADQISKLLKYCNKNHIPVIPFGAGSGFEGGVNALQVKLDGENEKKIIYNESLKHLRVV